MRDWRRRGFDRIAPGVYLHQGGRALCLDRAELVQAAGLADTPRARDQVARATREDLAAAYPGVPIGEE